MSTMSDVLPPSNQEALPPGPTVPPKNQAAIERLRKRMEGYREMQTSRLPEYEQTMNHMNSQQMQETLALRQKFLESKAKKPNKKSSSSGSADKMKHDMSSSGPGPAAANNMNGIMQFHPPPSHNGPPMVPMGLNGPSSHNGPMLQNGPSNMMNHGPGGPSHNKRPLEDDSSNIQSETAKRLNLDNGNISDQNFIKREPSPLETKFNPGGGNYGPQGPTSAAKPPTSQASPCPDVKPNVNSLNQEMKESAALSQSEPKAQLPDRSDIKEEFKAEVSDSLKQEDTLGDLDLKDFDFDGMNADSLQDLMDDLPENFIDDFDFENSKIASDDKESENISNCETSENGQHSTVSSCHSSSSSSTSNSVSQSNMTSTASTPAAETLKMMAQQHQHPPSSQPGPGQNFPGYQQPPSSAISSGGPPATDSAPNMMGGGGPGGPRMPHQGAQDGDPRLRAAASQRFRMGNPNSIANNMGPTGGPSMMGNQRVAQMGNNNMMGNMAGNQPGMGGNMQMMNQQQVNITGHSLLSSLIYFIDASGSPRNGSDESAAADDDADEDAAPEHDEGRRANVQHDVQWRRHGDDGTQRYDDEELHGSQRPRHEHGWDAPKLRPPGHDAGPGQWHDARHAGQHDGRRSPWRSPRRSPRHAARDGLQTSAARVRNVSTGENV